MYKTLEIRFGLARLDADFADEDDCKQTNATHATPEELLSFSSPLLEILGHDGYRWHHV